MIVLMKLLEKNKEFVIYSYGYDEDNLDGQVKVPLNNPLNYVILKESEDKRIGKLGTLKAINKIIKVIESNNIEELISYQC